MDMFISYRAGSDILSQVVTQTPVNVALNNLSVTLELIVIRAGPYVSVQAS